MTVIHMVVSSTCTIEDVHLGTKAWPELILDENAGLISCPRRILTTTFIFTPWHMLVITLNGTITKVVNEIKVKTNDTIITQLPSPSSRIIHAERSVKIYSFLKVAVCHMIILDKIKREIWAFKDDYSSCQQHRVSTRNEQFVTVQSRHLLIIFHK